MPDCTLILYLSAHNCTQQPVAAARFKRCIGGLQS